MSEGALAPRRRISALFALAVLAVGVGHVAVAHAEPTPRAGSASSSPSSEVGSLFQAQRRLESIGLRGLASARLALGQSPAGSVTTRDGAREPEAYRARITSPTLAFMHGVCDARGGLPKFGETIGVSVYPGGIVEIRTSEFGQLLDVDDRPTSLWLWEPAKLGDRIQVRRTSQPRSP